MYAINLSSLLNTSKNPRTDRYNNLTQQVSTTFAFFASAYSSCVTHIAICLSLALQ